MKEWIVPDWPAPPSVGALATTRHGGVSKPPFDGLNLGGHVGDDPDAVEANRARLLDRVPRPPLWLNQVHGTAVARAGSAAPGCTADAAVSVRPGAVCAVLTADCLPVLLCDRAGTRVGAAHAGWRGLAAGVLEAAVEALEAPRGELMAWLGPAIGPSSFEVGDEVRTAFMARDSRAAEAFSAKGGGKWRCDLYLLARQRLAAAGVREVRGGGWDTAADAGRFYSYRRDGRTGRMATLIWLR